MALAFALAGTSSAKAKVPLRAAPAHHQVKVQARPSVIARAAGHKIA